MTLVKGPNGLVIDVAPAVASGLISGGHVEAAGKDVPEIGDTDEDSVESTEVADTDEAVKPGGNASKQVWHDYALDQGFAEEQLDGLKQSEIRALFED